MTAITPAVTAVVYGAKSTADPNGSIETQLEDCRAAAEAEGREVLGQFKDGAKSAYHDRSASPMSRARTASCQGG
jgi:hypothetical protein